jgi:hypothetical protein
MTIIIIIIIIITIGQDLTAGVCCGAEAGRLPVRFPMVSLGFFRLKPSGRTMALGSTHPLTDMTTRCISWG